MTDYVQVNNVRFWSIVGIVALHSYLYPSVEDYPAADILRLFLIQVFKFGTLCFFIISGYLLGDKINDYNPVEFFKRRVNNIAKPWLAWSLFFGTILSIVSLTKTDTINILNIVIKVFFDSEYWFVLNYLIALAILILFRRYINYIWFGFITFLISLFYGMNIYLSIFPTSHTYAIFGFIFFLWLGYYLRINGNLRDRINSYSKYFLILLLFSYLLAVAEAYLVGIYGHSSDIHNTLRITNQFYGIIVFVMLFNFSWQIYPKYFNPRGETFGIYLSHWVVLYFIIYIVTKLISLKVGVDGKIIAKNSMLYINELEHFIIWLLTFVFVYGMSLGITKMLGRTKYYWLVGKTKRDEIIHIKVL